MSKKYFYIDNEKEIIDIIILSKLILQSNIDWKNLILVNCSPDYSSSLVQVLNHKISIKNENELFEVINLPMPYPNKDISIYDGVKSSYEEYLKIWKIKHYNKKNTYLFIDSGCLRGLNFSKLKDTINDSKCLFAALYLQKDSIFKPDFFTESFSNVTTKGLLFWWENILNPNWNY